MKYPALMHNLTKVSCVKCYSVVPVISTFLMLLVHSVCMYHISSLPPYRAAFSWTDVLSVIWPSQNLGHSSHLQSWRRLGNRKASGQRWAMAKSLLVSSLVLFCYSKGLDAATDFQLLCGLKNSGVGLWRCSWNSRSDTHSPPCFTVVASSKYISCNNIRFI